MKHAPRPEPDPVVEAYKKDIDRTLIRENLKLTVALARFAEEDAARRPRGSYAEVMTDFEKLLVIVNPEDHDNRCPRAGSPVD